MQIFKHSPRRPNHTGRGLHLQTPGRKGEGEKKEKEKGVEERGIPTPKLILYTSSTTIIEYDEKNFK
jgi:hypothetical protein